mmetsp:Transcript_22359/g.60434  ORF Transcript_22359/g.60434 Transcript_22359/m.60434 type:complete len:207 (+) Transcript_22359:354-974(+)
MWKLSWISLPRLPIPWRKGESKAKVMGWTRSPRYQRLVPLLQQETRSQPSGRSREAWREVTGSETEATSSTSVRYLLASGRGDARTLTALLHTPTGRCGDLAKLHWRFARGLRRLRRRLHAAAATQRPRGARRFRLAHDHAPATGGGARSRLRDLRRAPVRAMPPGWGCWCRVRRCRSRRTARHRRTCTGRPARAHESRSSPSALR